MIKKYPLAITSVILGVVSFVHLFGLEKAVLAIVLGWLALKEVAPESIHGKKYAYIGIILGSLYVLTIVAIAVVKGPDIINVLSKTGR